jgi:putative two-component system response regulator
VDNKNLTKDQNIRKKIFLVDDDEIQLTTTELLFKNEYDIFKIKSGKETLDYLNKIEDIPDLIMLDIVLMPEMDGWEIYDKITDIASLKAMPIVFFTSLDEASAKEIAYELRAVEYITKPCDKINLTRIVMDSIQKKDLKKQQYSI